MTATTSHAPTAPIRADFFDVDYDKKDAAEQRANAAGLEPCFRCGRGIKPGSGWRVEVLGGGSSVALPGSNPDVNDKGYMGTYPVGSECGKYFPAPYRLKNDGRLDHETRLPWEA